MQPSILHGIGGKIVLIADRLFDPAHGAFGSVHTSAGGAAAVAALGTQQVVIGTAALGAGRVGANDQVFFLGIVLPFRNQILMRGQLYQRRLQFLGQFLPRFDQLRGVALGKHFRHSGAPYGFDSGFVSIRRNSSVFLGNAL